MTVLRWMLLAAVAGAGGCAVYPSQPYYPPQVAVVPPVYGYGYAGPSMYLAPAPLIVGPRLFLGGGVYYGGHGGRRHGGWGRGHRH